MRRAAHRRRGAEVGLIAFQLLAYRVEVFVEDDGLEPVLAYLANGAAQPLDPRATMRYAITGGGPYRLFEEDEHLATLDRPDDVLYVLYRRCHARLGDSLSRDGWVPLHAAVASIAGRRVLLIGEKGTGKTTLMLRLLYDGHAVEGDELVLTRAGEAVCLPRNFHLKAGAPDLVPELCAVWPSLPTTSTSDGVVITAFDPAAAGFSWQLRRGPVDAGFVLRANHGGRPSCRPISSVDVVEAAVTNSFPAAITARDVVRAHAALLGAVRGHELTIGKLTATATLLTATAAKLSE